MALGVDPSVTFNDLPPELQQMADQARQRQAMALALQKQFLQPTMPTNTGPVMSRMSALQPLAQALGSYVASKNAGSANEDLAGVAKQYQGAVDAERQGLQGLSPAERIAQLQASRYAPNRALAEAQQKSIESQAQVTHLQHADAVADAQTDIARGTLDVHRQQMLNDADYKNKYMTHLDNQLTEAVRHNQVDEANRIQQLKIEAGQLGVQQQMLGVHRFGVGLNPKTGEAPDLSDRIDDILNLKRPAPGTGPQGRTGSNPAIQAQLDTIMAEASKRGIPFDPMGYWNKQKAIAEFLPTAPAGTQIRSFANVDQHLGMLQDLSNAMGSGNYKLVNEARQAWQKATGNPLPTDFNAIKMLVAGELQKAMAVHGGGENERRDFLVPIQTANAPAVIAGALRNYRGVLGVQRDNLVAQGRQAGVPESMLTITPTEHAPAAGTEPDPAAVEAELRRRGLLK